MTPNAQHKRAERERRTDRGDKRVECWLPKDEWQRVKDAAAFAEITTEDVIRQAIARL